MTSTRRAPSDGATGLSSVVAMSGAHLNGVLDIERASFPNPWTREGFLTEIRQPFSHPVVVQLESRVAGYCVCWLLYERLHILNIAVNPELRGRGYATRLLHVVLENGRAAGATSANLEVRAGNALAIRLYLSNGFRMLQHQKNLYTNPSEDGLLFGLDLRTESLTP